MSISDERLAEMINLCSITGNWPDTLELFTELRARRAADAKSEERSVSPGTATALYAAAGDERAGRDRRGCTPDSRNVALYAAQRMQVRGPDRRRMSGGIRIDRKPIGKPETTERRKGQRRANPDHQRNLPVGAYPLRGTDRRKAGRAEEFSFLAHIFRAKEFSERTFGPGHRTKGVIDHIRKELIEVESSPLDLEEWVDVWMLALDGAWRTGATPEQIIAQIVAKQIKNEGRKWPDWRTADRDKGIEHDRSQEAPAPERCQTAGHPSRDSRRETSAQPDTAAKAEQSQVANPAESHPYMQTVGGKAYQIRFVAREHIKDRPTEANPSPIRVLLVYDIDRPEGTAQFQTDAEIDSRPSRHGPDHDPDYAPTPCRHEWYQGVCVHCNLLARDWRTGADTHLRSDLAAATSALRKAEAERDAARTLAQEADQLMLQRDEIRKERDEARALMLEAHAALMSGYAGDIKVGTRSSRHEDILRINMAVNAFLSRQSPEGAAR